MKDVPAKYCKINQIGEWPRWQSGKTLGSYPPVGTSNLQLFTEQLLVKSPEAYQKRAIERKHNKTGRKGRVWYSQNSYPQVGDL